MRKPQGLQQGFTLVEIAIVLVIIGLLLGGILRGQELIQNARVRNIIDQQNGIKAAFSGFQDRFRMIPGDLTAAQVAQVGAGVIVAGTPGTGVIDATDSAAAFQNITTTGFISCQTCTAAAAAVAGAGNSPSNVYGGVLQLVTDGAYSTPTQILPGDGAVRHNIKTGNLIPSNVLYEADVKVDDGVPNGGQFRFSNWTAAGGVAPVATCQNGAAAAATPWQTTQNAIQPNCGGVTLIN